LQQIMLPASNMDEVERNPRTVNFSADIQIGKLLVSDKYLTNNFVTFFNLEIQKLELCYKHFCSGTYH